MNQLLARMRGEPGRPSENTPHPVTTVSELAYEPGVRKLRMHREPLLTPEATSYQPRGEAPLVVANLELMRQIANESARNAIAVHARNSWLDAARANLIGAIAGIVGAFLSLLYWNSNLLLALLGVTTGLAVTAWLGQRVWLIRKELFSAPQARRHQSRMDRPHADRSAEETAS